MAAPCAVRAATTSQATRSSAYSTTDAPRSAPVWLRAASAIVPVTHVPTGNVKLHQVSAKGRPHRSRRAARTVIAAARTSHAIANPHAGTPYSSASTAAPDAYGAGSTPAAAVPRTPAAVTDWPSGPSTIHSVGTRTAGPAPRVTSRDQIWVMMITEANRLMPNIA